MAYSNWYHPKIQRRSIDFKSDVLLDGTQLTAAAADLNDLTDNVTGLASFVTAGLGVSEAVEQADHETSPEEIVAADTGDRVVLIAVICTTDVVGATEPTFAFGEQDGAADKFLDTTKFTAATAGDIVLGAGVLTEDKALRCTITEGDDDGGTGDTPAGAFDVLVLLLPTS